MRKKAGSAQGITGFSIANCIVIYTTL